MEVGLCIAESDAQAWGRDASALGALAVGCLSHSSLLVGTARIAAFRFTGTSTLRWSP